MLAPLPNSFLRCLKMSVGAGLAIKAIAKLHCETCSQKPILAYTSKVAQSYFWERTLHPDQR